MSKALVLGLASILLSGCSTVVENRVETALVEAGVSPAMAGCMAPMWADRLSVEQIRGIGRFADNVRSEGRQLTVAALIEHARAWNDVRALEVVVSSAARCALS